MLLFIFFIVFLVKNVNSNECFNVCNINNVTITICSENSFQLEKSFCEQLIQNIESNKLNVNSTREPSGSSPIEPSSSSFRVPSSSSPIEPSSSSFRVPSSISAKEPSSNSFRVPSSISAKEPSSSSLIEPSSSSFIEPSISSLIEPSSSSPIEPSSSFKILINEIISNEPSSKISYVENFSNFNQSKETLEPNYGYIPFIISMTLFLIIGLVLYRKLKLIKVKSKILPVDPRDVKLTILDFKRPKDYLLEKLKDI